ncbi:hypothetical protein niasHT_005710 [Heterodera trifolii]|uniref:Uncharacterized protein n=1 Tax=Heterodera trifolii TaxID=157864 RepID=A0ABD2LP64_9BILA
MNNRSFFLPILDINAERKRNYLTTCKVTSIRPQSIHSEERKWPILFRTKEQCLRSEATAKHGKTSSAICCNFGKICLPKLSDPPAELSALSSENSAEAKEFRKNQNAYNSLLAFASVSVGYKENSVGGDVCFMLNGLFVRRISSIFSGQMAPNFAQLFVLDPEQALEHRKQNTRYGGDRVNPNTLKNWMQYYVNTIHWQNNS